MAAVTAGVVGSAVIGAASAKQSADKGAKAAREASQASERAADASIAEQQRQFDLVREDTQVQRDVGNQSISRLNNLLGQQNMGLNTRSQFSDVQSNPLDPSNYQFNPQQSLDPSQYAFDPSQVQMDPGYQFRQEQGQQGLNNMLQSQGRQLGGAALKEAMRYNQGFASNEYQNAYGRAMGENQLSYSRDMMANQQTNDRSLQANQLNYQRDLTANESGFNRDMATNQLQIDEYERARREQDTNMSRLFTLAGFGPAGAQTSAQAGAASAGSIGNIMMANAQSQGQAAQAGAAASAAGYQGINNAFQSGLQNYMTYNTQQNLMNMYAQQGAANTGMGFGGYGVDAGSYNPNMYAGAV